MMEEDRIIVVGGWPIKESDLKNIENAARALRISVHEIVIVISNFKINAEQAANEMQVLKAKLKDLPFPDLNIKQQYINSKALKEQHKADIRKGWKRR